MKNLKPIIDEIEALELYLQIVVPKPHDSTLRRLSRIKKMVEDIEGTYLLGRMER